MKMVKETLHGVIVETVNTVINLKMEIPTLISIISLILIPVILISLTIFVRYYKKKQEEKKAKELAAKKNIIRAVITEADEVELIEGGTIESSKLELDLLDKTVYVKYYADYKPMLCMISDPKVGYVLISETEEDAKPKFYHPHEVFVGIPRQDMVEGYIDDEEEIFIITNRRINDRWENLTVKTSQYYNDIKNSNEYIINP